MYERNRSDLPSRRGRSSLALCLALLALAGCRDSTGSGPAPLPVLSAVAPGSALVGAGDVTLTVTGSGFGRQSVVRFHQLELSTTYVSATRLTATVPAEQLQAGGVANVTVHTPAPGGGTSAARPFEVRYPVPTLSALSTDTARAGRPAAPVTVTGTGFGRGTVVRWNGAARTTTYISATQVSFVPDPADLATGAAAQVSVFNPEPGGGASAGAAFNVFNPVPVITLLPSQGGVAGTPGYDVPIHGSGFVPGATVSWNGAARPTTFVADTRLTVALTPADVAVPGAGTLRVTNPASNGAVSNPAIFTLRRLGEATRTIIRLEVAARDLAWDPVSAHLYAAVPVGAWAGRVVAINPETRSVFGSIEVGDYPWKVAVSDDGQALYVAMHGGRSYRRLRLPDLLMGPEWPLGTAQAPMYALDLQVVPGQSDVVAVARGTASGGWGGIAVYENGVQRPNTAVQFGVAETMAFLGSASTLYAYNTGTSGFEFYTIALDGTGARQAAATRDLIAGYGREIVGAGGRIYSESGAIVDAERRVRVGTVAIPPDAFEHTLTADPATGRIFVVTPTEIVVYDMLTLQPLGSLSVPNQVYDTELAGPNQVVRFGTDGLAFYDEQNVILVRSPLIGP